MESTKSVRPRARPGEVLREKSTGLPRWGMQPPRESGRRLKPPLDVAQFDEKKLLGRSERVRRRVRARLAQADGLAQAIARRARKCMRYTCNPGRSPLGVPGRAERPDAGIRTPRNRASERTHVDSDMEPPPRADASAREQVVFGPLPSADESPRLALVRALAAALPALYAGADSYAVRVTLDALRTLASEDVPAAETPAFRSCPPSR